MPREPRPLIPGGIYHLTSRGNRRQRIIGDELDWRMFTSLLDGAVERCGWICHSFCILPNHYHLVVQTPVPNLSLGMQQLNGSYAQAYNWRHGLDGHLFQGRFHSRVVESDPQLLETIRYVALNPVRAGLCHRPEAWRWGSYRALVGLEPAPRYLTTDWTLSQFSPSAERARRLLRTFVDDARADAA